MSSRAPSGSAPHHVARAVVALAGVGIALLGLNLLLDTPAPTSATAPLTPGAPSRPPGAPSRLPHALAPLVAAPAPEQDEVVAAAHDEMLDAAGHDRHPHPITPAHERLRRERHFVASLDDAMDARSGALLREKLEQYRREFPEDHQRLQAGYAVIADCLEHGESARASAEKYYQERRGSTLRRWVRRLCLEPSPVRRI